MARAKRDYIPGQIWHLIHLNGLSPATTKFRIPKGKRKNVLIHYEKLRELLSMDSYDLLKEYHKGWVEEYLDNGSNSRDDKWTKSIAVGSKGFIEEVKFLLGAMAKGRKNLKAAEGYQLREPSAPYSTRFDIKNEDIGNRNF